MYILVIKSPVGKAKHVDTFIRNSRIYLWTLVVAQANTITGGSFQSLVASVYQSLGPAEYNEKLRFKIKNLHVTRWYSAFLLVMKPFQQSYKAYSFITPVAYYKINELIITNLFLYVSTIKNICEYIGLIRAIIDRMSATAAQH